MTILTNIKCINAIYNEENVKWQMPASFTAISVAVSTYIAVHLFLCANLNMNRISLYGIHVPD
jgi:hypothetical protein